MERLSEEKWSGYAAWIAGVARWALEEEVRTTPKPGLVDLGSNGAHLDMNAALFLKSAEALEPYFAQAAWMGMSLNVSPEALFTLLRRWGKWAEREMYTATGDVNTHKGAIFTMGVFCAAIGRCVHDGNMDMESIRTLEQQMVSKQLQRELETLSQREAITYGEKNYCRYGSRGIRGAAINGYSEVFEEALPILKEGKRQNKDWNRVKLQVLITLMSRIEDSNIIARRDLPTLKAVQQNMRDFLAQGGAYQETAIEKLQRMDREFSRKNISGGGSADLLALTIFINRITEELEIQPIAETGWKIGYALNDTTLFKRYIMLRYMVAASVMIAVILFFALFFICNYYIVRPVFDLHRQIAFVTSGGLSKRIHMERRDEIGSIAKVINTMLDHQMEISYRMLHTQQDLYEAELKEKENELRILENQVNPHFILNTLQCICGIATTYNAQEVVDIATAMGKIFEYSLRAPENVTLRQEMNIVQEYLEIVDIRFENRFIWDMDIQEELLDARMPKMILQPLVENAIYHGLEKKGRGIVQIFCEEGEGGLWIHIWDNGAGIEAKKLEKIKEFLQDEREMHRISMKVKRIGIANTCLRIKNFFGSAYGIEIDSIEGSGTEVTIHMSLEREERDQSRFCQ